MVAAKDIDSFPAPERAHSTRPPSCGSRSAVSPYAIAIGSSGSPCTAGGGGASTRQLLHVASGLLGSGHEKRLSYVNPPGFSWMFTSGWKVEPVTGAVQST